MLNRFFKLTKEDNRYMVSSDGYVYSSISKRCLKPVKDRHGYKYVNLGYLKRYSIHRLVANNFLDRIEGRDVVNHKNLIKWDNRASNLEWCNLKENMRHAVDNGAAVGRPSYTMVGFLNVNSVITPKMKEEIILDRASGTKYKDLVNRYGVSKSTLHRLINKKTYV